MSAQHEILEQLVSEQGKHIKELEQKLTNISELSSIKSILC
jgi:hypothetical protein